MANKRIGAAAVIRDEQGRVLLVKHNYGKCNWELPGGRAEADESAAGTAERETMEETGLAVKAGRLTGVYYDPGFDMHHFVFAAERTADGVPVPSPDEIVACGYFAVDDLPRPISDFTVNRILDAASGEREAAFRIIGPRQWLE